MCCPDKLCLSPTTTERFYLGLLHRYHINSISCGSMGQVYVIPESEFLFENVPKLIAFLSYIQTFSTLSRADINYFEMVAVFNDNRNFF